MSRANRADVRNPVLRLPSAAKLAALPPDVRALVRQAFRETSADCRVLAEKSWRKHKAPMASYWKQIAVYARHFAMVLR